MRDISSALTPAAIVGLLGKMPARELAVEVSLAGVALPRLGVHDPRRWMVAELRRELEVVRFQWPADGREWGNQVRRRIAS